MTCKQGILEKEQAEVLIIGVAEDRKLDFAESPTLRQLCERFLELNDFKCKLNETAFLYVQGEIDAKRVCLVGLDENKSDLDAVRQAAGTAAKAVMKKGVSRLSLALESFISEDGEASEVAQAVSEGALLATYQFMQYKEIEDSDKLKIDEVICLFESSDLTENIEKGVGLGQKTATAANLARDLQNEPGNRMTPTRLAEVAQELAKRSSLTCEILDRTAMKDLKMGALLGVAKGSLEPPRFIILEHNADNPGLDTIVLVGKGITFDSGGISIKPSADMEEMKFDMSGGAAVIGGMKAVADLEIPLHVVGLVPAAENLPSGSSMKPGDILTASSGTTIEIVNTDAEGRLVLADALVYAKRYEPKAVIDLATLTGACVVALGYYATGLFGTDEDLQRRLQAAGEKSGERVWPFPLWEQYHEEMKSDYADLKNASGRWGGAVTAAAFLAKFAEDYPWAHLDIAGTAYTAKESGYLCKGGTGVGVRLLVQFLKDWVAANS
ncbi:leucyl aminopeptidase [bacterium]|nr:leucyl aminopeptidase [bacterium]